MRVICNIRVLSLALLLAATASAAFEDVAGPELSEFEGLDGWPQFHLGPDHVGASQSTALWANQTAWVSEEIGAKAGSSLSVAEGKIFVNCNDFLVSLDEFTGKTLWKVPCEPNPYGSWSSPAYCDGKVFFSNYETLCLDPKDGCVELRAAERTWRRQWRPSDCRREVYRQRLGWSSLLLPRRRGGL